MLDVFTKYLKLYPMKRAATWAVLDSYKEFLNTVGKPERVLTDLGAQFTANSYKEGIQEWGIQMAFTSVRHPQADPVERCMRELGRLCGAYCGGKHQSWAFHLAKFEDWLNRVQHRSTGFIPGGLMFKSQLGEVFGLVEFPDMILPEPRDQVLEALERQAGIRRNRSPTIRKWASEFKQDDLVWIRSSFQSSALEREIKEFFPLCVGPYVVLKVVHFDTCLLGEMITKEERGIFNIGQLKPCVLRPDWLSSSSSRGGEL
jgi:hypothetical protein